MRYQFNKGRISISLPLLLGGKSSAELNIPPTLKLPQIQIPLIGLDIPENNYKIPSFTIPRALDFSLPMLGVAELSVKMDSNFYYWECSILGGNNTVDVPNYIAKYKMMASCPVTPLSYKIEGIQVIKNHINLIYKADCHYGNFNLLEFVSLHLHLNVYVFPPSHRYGHDHWYSQ